MSFLGVRILLLLAVLSCWGTVYSSLCIGTPQPNVPNTNPLITSPLTLVDTVPNGKLYSYGEGDNVVPVAHLWGTPYEKGFAYGSMLQEPMTNFMNETWAYMLDQMEQAINGSGTFPWNSKLLPWLSEVGLEDGLDWVAEVTRPFTGQHFFDEMRGMSDATGIDYKLILRVHMIPEFTKGQCSMVGAWGSSLPVPNGLTMARAFDWDFVGPFKDYPAIVVYHGYSNDTYSENTFINIGWVGWMASLSGISEQQVAIGMIGVSFPDATFGQESFHGIPFTFVLRDILQFDQYQIQGVSRLASAHRTCDLIMGVAGGRELKYNAVQYSASVCNIISDYNLLPVGNWHQPITNVVYHGMDWDCPKYDQALMSQLQGNYGNLTAETLIRVVLPLVNTGNLHAWAADLVNMQMYVSFAARDGVSGPPFAYDRPYFSIDLNPSSSSSFFNEQPPELKVITSAFVSP